MRHFAIPAVFLFLAAAVSGQQSDQERERLRELQSLPYVANVDAETEGATGVIGSRKRESTPGVNFYANRFTNNAFLVDNGGNVLHKWELKDRSSWLEAWALPAGELIVLSGWDPNRQKEFPDEKGFQGAITKISADSRLLWRKQLNGHHDLRILRDGKIVTLVERPRTQPRDPRKFMDNVVAILSPQGDLLEERSVYDLLHSTPGLKLLPVDAQTAAALGVKDIFHCNSVQWIDAEQLRAIGSRATASPVARKLYADSNVVITCRHQNFVAVFNWKDKKIVWAWGQQKDGLDGPHAASLLPNGNILVYDNGLLRGYSRIIEIDPLTNKVAWEFTAKEPKDFYNAVGGHVQKLESGNVLITDSGRYQVLEVTSEQRVVWKWVNPDRTFTYRMTRLPLAYFTAPFRGQWLTPEQN